MSLVADEQPICPKCGQAPHPECRDGFIFPKDSETGDLLINPATGGPRVLMCPRIRLKKTLKRLGPELAAAKHLRGGSPLLTLGKKGEPPTVDLRGTNTFITGCAWSWLRPHLRYALGLDWSLSFKIITDQHIKAVFVGSESYKARARDIRDDSPTYNSLGDLVGPPDLVILRLGHLGHKNRAAAGAIKEALRIRETLNKPTWLVDEADHPWSRSFSYDPDLEDYIDDNFKTVKVEGVDPGEEEVEEEEDVGMGVEDEDEFEAPPAKKTRKKKRRPKPPPEDEDVEVDDGGFDESDFDLPGEKPKWRRS